MEFINYVWLQAMRFVWLGQIRRAARIARFERATRQRNHANLQRARQEILRLNRELDECEALLRECRAELEQKKGELKTADIEITNLIWAHEAIKATLQERVARSSMRRAIAKSATEESEDEQDR